MKVVVMWLVMEMVCYSSVAQNLRSPVATQYVAAGTYSANFTDVFSASSNQAALARLIGIHVACYAEKRYLLSELGSYRAIVSENFSNLVLAFQTDFLGFKNYSELQIGLAVARKLNEKIDLGFKLNYYSLKIPGYGSASSINFEMGVLFHISQKLHSGIHIYNPLSSKLGRDGTERLSSIVKMSVGYEVSPQVLVYTEIAKEEFKDALVAVGLLYYVSKKFLIQLSAGTGDASIYAGVGFIENRFRFCFSFSLHQYLGYSPGFLVSYQPEKNQSN